MDRMSFIFPSLKSQQIKLYLFSEPTFKSWDEQYILGDSTFGYFSVSAKQGTKHCVENYNRMNLLTLLSIIGGLISTLTVSIRSLMYNYMYFTIDKS